jgi:hypothetical protein
MNSMSKFRHKLQKEKQAHTYDILAYHYDVNKYYLWKIINDENYYPPNKVCLLLGLPALAPAPVCGVCGDVHTKRHPYPRRPRQTWMSEEEVEERLKFVLCLTERKIIC